MLEASLGTLNLRDDKLAIAQSLGSAAGEALSEVPHEFTNHYDQASILPVARFTGLNPQYEVTAPAQLESGRSGIARDYSENHS